MPHGIPPACERFRVQFRFRPCPAIGPQAKYLFFGTFRIKRTSKGDESIDRVNCVRTWEVKVKVCFSQFRVSSLLAFLLLATQGIFAQSVGLFSAGSGLRAAHQPS